MVLSQLRQVPVARVIANIESTTRRHYTSGDFVNNKAVHLDLGHSQIVLICSNAMEIFFDTFYL